jgi:hypothetical protein
MIQRYIVVSESITGSHQFTVSSDNEVAQYAMTFPTTIIKDGEKYIIGTSLQENETFKEILLDYKHAKKQSQVSILVAFDLDENGEIMSEVLLDSLMSNDVDPLDVFRVPLSENGYIAVKDFSNTSHYKHFLYHQQQIAKNIQAIGLKPLSVHKIYSLKRLTQHKGKEFDISTSPTAIKQSGTSTATFIHNFLQHQR